MRAIAANPKDKAAEAVLSQDRAFHAMLRRTCVATLLDGGHANNALPQRAGPTSIAASFPATPSRSSASSWSRSWPTRA